MDADNTWTKEQFDSELNKWKEALELAFKERSVSKHKPADGDLELRINLNEHLISALASEPAG